MTNSSHLFNTCSACFSQKIKVADATLAAVAGQGTIVHTPISLTYVLHVSKLFVNLLSIPKITRDLNCKVIVSHSHCTG